MPEKINPNATHIKWCTLKPELDENLCATYPKIFRDRHGHMRETNMCWGFDVGDGWYDLINELCAKMQKECDETGIQVIASQVKEKFGSLRFYTHGETDTIDKMIEEAAKKSKVTCEVCGNPGNLYEQNHWLTTRCATHADPAAENCDLEI